jgi:hypothetical protein
MFVYKMEKVETWSNRSERPTLRITSNNSITVAAPMDKSSVEEAEGALMSAKEAHRNNDA